MVPTAADVLLVIEVADSTMAHDRGTKIPLYARHGIPEVWLFGVASERVTIYRDPVPEGYRTVVSPERGAAISPLLKPEAAIVVAEIWPVTTD